VDELPLFCRSCSKLDRNVCKAAVPLLVLLVELVLEPPDALAEPVVPVVDALVVVPPRSLISCENAVLKSDMALADRLEGVPDAAEVLPITSLLVMSLISARNASMMP